MTNKPRRFDLVAARVADILEENGLPVGPLRHLIARSYYTPPELSTHLWVDLCRYLSHLVESGRLQTPGPDSPGWVHRVSDIVEGRESAGGGE